MTDLFSPGNGRLYHTHNLHNVTDHLRVWPVHMSRLVDRLDTPHWDDDTSARDVLNSPWCFIRHIIRITRADMSYPILLLEGSLVVLDGMHRLTKAYVMGKETINARIVPMSVVEACREWVD